MKKCLKNSSRKLIDTIYTMSVKSSSGEKIYDIFYLTKNLL